MMPLVVDTTVLTRRDLAQRVGVSVHTVRSWALGRRFPDPATKRKVASVLRDQARLLQHLADMLDATIESQSRQEVRVATGGRRAAPKGVPVPIP